MADELQPLGAPSNSGELSPLEQYTSPKAVMATAEFVKRSLEGQGAGHDWDHVQRVWTMAKRIALEEGDVDVALVEQAALLHDLKDYKFAGGDEEAGPEAAQSWLLGQGMELAKAQHVAEIIRTLSFKGANTATPMATKEGAIVQDADRLDAIGAIGIARVFEFGGSREEPIYDPAIPFIQGEDATSYKARLQGKRPTINHFNEKLLLLRDRMNTAAARHLADGRHEVLKAFLAQFKAEWDASWNGKFTEKAYARALRSDIGAIGIARLFDNGGRTGVTIDESIRLLREELSKRPSIFARILRRGTMQRFVYMQAFLEQFDAETQGQR